MTELADAETALTAFTKALSRSWSVIQELSETLELVLDDDPWLIEAGA